MVLVKYVYKFRTEFGWEKKPAESANVHRSTSRLFLSVTLMIIRQVAPRIAAWCVGGRFRRYFTVHTYDRSTGVSTSASRPANQPINNRAALGVVCPRRCSFINYCSERNRRRPPRVTASERFRFEKFFCRTRVIFSELRALSIWQIGDGPASRVRYAFDRLSRGDVVSVVRVRVCARVCACVRDERAALCCHQLPAGAKRSPRALSRREISDAMTRYRRRCFCSGRPAPTSVAGSLC